MVKGNVPALHLDPETHRALQLDALAAILPIDRRDRLAELLTDDDVETLKHLAREGMGEDSLRVLASDLAYLEAWADGATGQPLPWPATEALALKFVAHHLRDPSKRASDPRHGMPVDVAESLQAEGLLCCDGPPAPSTVKRRLASWSTLHRWREDRGTVRASPRPRPGCLGSADRDLCDGSSSRYPGSRHPPLGVRVWRAPARRSGAAARRAAEG
jgi:hypothetical protein